MPVNFHHDPLDDVFLTIWSPPTKQEKREPETHNGKNDKPLSFCSEREGGR